MHALKLIAAAATVAGITLAFVERLNAPSYLVLEKSKKWPDWAGWLGLILASVGALSYIALDLLK